MKTFTPFDVLPEFVDSYRSHTDSGIDHVKEKKIIVTGLVRNVEKFLANNIKQLFFLGKTCAELSYFLYENDSSDNTIKVLNDLSQSIPNFKFLSEKLDLPQFGPTKDIQRTVNLATARNKCSEYIKKTYYDYDYVMVVDLDYNYIDPYGILNSFGHFADHDIDGICGNSYQIVKKPNDDTEYLWNYDSWAFRMNHWEFLGKRNNLYNSDPMLWFGMWRMPIGSDIIPIYSGFGGCCIYKVSKYTKGQYSGEDCEHVTFHKSLIDNNDQFALYINPSMYSVSVK
jgi:hypothetical protein